MEPALRRHGGPPRVLTVTQLIPQVIGVVSVGAFAGLISLGGWAALKALGGIRVSPEEEQEGLDLGEHGNVAYPEFQRSSVIQ